MTANCITLSCLFLAQGEKALFLELHRRCFACIDEWFGMTVKQVSELEKENDLTLKKVYNVTYTCEISYAYKNCPLS